MNPVLRTLWFSLFLETEEISVHAERAHQQVQVKLFLACPNLALWAQSLELDMNQGVLSGMSRHRESLSSACVKDQARETKALLRGCRPSIGLVIRVGDRLGSQGGPEGDVPWWVLCLAGVGMCEAGLRGCWYWWARLPWVGSP